LECELKNLREIVALSDQEGRVAMETAARHRETLEKIACRRAGVSDKHLELIRAVVEAPLLGACAPRFQRILDNARQKGLIAHVHGGILSIRSIHGAAAGNAWDELGHLGVQVMKDIHGEGWSYIRPSQQFTSIGKRP